MILHDEIEGAREWETTYVSHIRHCKHKSENTFSKEITYKLERTNPYTKTIYHNNLEKDPFWIVVCGKE